MREEEAPDPAEIISWEERRLCPDGSCLGVVGADGACNECGRVDPEAARLLDERAAAQRERKSKVSSAAVGEPADGDDGGEDGERDGEGDGENASAASSSAVGASAGEPGDDWQRRQLCEDGACIGVVIDGRCNTCGKAQ